MITKADVLSGTEGAKTMSVVIPVSLYRRLIAQSMSSGEPMAQIYRSAVDMYLRSVEQPEKQSAV